MKLPEQRNYQQAYELAYKLACEQLARIDDVEQQCRKADAQCEVTGSQKVISIAYLNRPYVVTLPEIEVSLADSGESVPIKDKVLILHYLISAKGTPLADKSITYKELPGGHIYFPTFYKRITRPLVKNFGQEPDLLLEAAGRLGGRKADYGDIAVTIDAFSQVPVTIILWRGDEEFPPEAGVVFDATISDYLSGEDTTVLCEAIIWKLVGYLRETKAS